MRRLARLGVFGAAAALAACAQSGDPAVRQARADAANQQAIEEALGNRSPVEYADSPRETLWDLFRTNQEPARRIGVNRYLWVASLDILSFLPIEGADPFSGVITTDWGRVGGDPTPVRVTVYITEAALDASALKVAAFRMSGGRSVPVAQEQNRQLENAILTRARQLRIQAAG